MFSAATKTDGASTAANYIEDVFSTYLYTGNGVVQTIPNGIALGSAYGGSVYFETAFSGSGTYLETSSSSVVSFGTQPFTIEAWIYWSSIPSQSAILWGNGVGWTLYSFPSNKLQWGTTTPQTPANLLSGSTTLVTGQWYHIAVTRNASNVVTLWVNGVADGSVTDASNYSANGSLTIGLSHSGNYFKGFMSNIRVVKGAALYTSTFTPSTTPLTAISGTSLLTCQSPNPIIDYSANAYSIAANTAYVQNGGGPFTDSTANKGGLVWLKGRSGATDHALYDTVRGATFDLVSNSTAAQTTQTTGLTAFNSNGFSIGALAKLNTNAATYTSWTFREQAKFFDVVTYTGNGANRTIAHNLGSVPGCIMVKRTDTTGAWAVYHRSLANTEYLVLNTTAAKATGATYWNSTTPTSTEFSLGTSTDVNASGGTYVAYLFAHDAGGFGPAGTDNVISCGSVVGVSGGTSVSLGYEPQWLLLKGSSTASDWWIVDNMRGLCAPTTNAKYLPANKSDAEANLGVNINATGFTTAVFSTGETYIYIAIRRGPMKTPTSGTSVLGLNARNGTGANATVTGGAGVTDLAIIKNRTGALGALWVPRLAGTGYLLSSAVTSETAATTTFLQANPWDVMDGVKVGTTSNTTNDSGATYINYLFDRAPGFFDVVCYTGDAATTRNVNHNLGVSPEFVIIKRRSANDNWHCWHTSLASISDYLLLNSTAAFATSSNIFKGMSSTTFTLGSDSGVNGSGSTYVAYLFATLAGVSKAGSYTGTGATLQIDCGFTAGARFVMIKRTDNTSNWFYWDTARGIVSGNDPYLLMNTTAIETTSTDYVDPYSAGFEISNNAVINASGATYIYLAIA